MNNDDNDDGFEEHSSWKQKELSLDFEVLKGIMNERERNFHDDHHDDYDLIINVIHNHHDDLDDHDDRHDDVGDHDDDHDDLGDHDNHKLCNPVWQNLKYLKNKNEVLLHCCDKMKT